jgi:CRP-like cAMP-binding protein
VKRTSIGPDGAERLGEIALFAGLSYGQRQMLARVADQVLAVAGEPIMRQGEAGHEFLVLEKGSAEVLQDGARIRVIRDGDFVGELAVLGDGAPRSASVVAISDLRALVFTAHYMREMHERVPELRERIDRAARERLERDAHASA